MIRAVLDTNVLISAIVFGGGPRQILEAAAGGSVQLYVSEATMAEFEGVLGRPQFGLSAQVVRAAASELASLAEWVVPAKTIAAVQEDPSDNRILECAVAASAECIVSGDAHLLKLRSYQGIGILAPQDFLRLLPKGR